MLLGGQEAFKLLSGISIATQTGICLQSTNKLTTLGKQTKGSITIYVSSLTAPRQSKNENAQIYRGLNSLSNVEISAKTKHLGNIRECQRKGK